MLKEGEIPSCLKCIYNNGPVCAKNAPNPCFPLVDGENEFCGEGLWLAEFTRGLTSFETPMETIERRDAKKR